MGVKTPYSVGASKQKMWQSMRILRVFTPSDIAQTAEVSVSYATYFVATLRKAGYLKRQTGSTGVFAQHQLLRNTGPRAPRHWTKERAVFDLNNGGLHELG